MLSWNLSSFFCKMANVFGIPFFVFSGISNTKVVIFRGEESETEHEILWQNLLEKVKNISLLRCNFTHLNICPREKSAITYKHTVRECHFSNGISIFDWYRGLSTRDVDFVIISPSLQFQRLEKVFGNLFCKTHLKQISSFFEMYECTASYSSRLVFCCKLAYQMYNQHGKTANIIPVVFQWMRVLKTEEMFHFMLHFHSENNICGNSDKVYILLSQYLPLPLVHVVFSFFLNKCHQTS